MTTTTTTNPATSSARPDADEERRRDELLKAMRDFANDEWQQTEMCVEVEGILDGVDDALMTRVLRRRGWYLVPNVSTYPTLQAYIDASYAALAADVRAYQAEVAAAEAAHRKRRRAELTAERAAEPPAPARAQPTRASKRARQRVILLCASLIKEEGPQTPFVSLYKVIYAL